MKMIKYLVQSFLHFFGLDLVKYPRAEVKRRGLVLKKFEIDLILDIGANKGQFATEVRESGYKNRIVSFEPLTEAFTILEKKAAKDSLWQVYKMAAGATGKTTAINISANSHSSSILEILPTHLQAAPQSQYVSKESVEVVTLDEFLPGLEAGAKNLFLKIDTQGYEWDVLQGVSKNLNRFLMVQMELSFVPLYEKEKLFDELTEWMKNSGFDFYSMEPGFYHPDTARLLQADVLFINRNVYQNSKHI